MLSGAALGARSHGAQASTALRIPFRLSSLAATPRSSTNRRGSVRPPESSAGRAPISAASSIGGEPWKSDMEIVSLSQDPGEARVAVVTTAGCPHCKRAKKALGDSGIAFREVNLEGSLEVLGKIKKLTGRTTVPQVFIGGKLVGGADEVIEMLGDGRLQDIIAEAAADSPLPREVDSLVAAIEAAPKERSSSLPAYVPKDMTEDEYNTLAELAEKMRSDAQNLKCRELKAGIFQKNKALNNCFLGTDAADWILRHSTASTRDEAVAICSRMMHAKLMRAVTPNGAITAGYQDAGDSFFQMSADAMKPTIGDPLNMSSLWDSDSRPAGEVATDLRKLIVALYDKFLSADGRGVDYDGMGKDPLFRQYITATTELQKVSIDQLGREERMAFFINIYNAIIVHGTAIYGPPASLPERLKWFKALKYNIGGLEYSADDIEHGILRGNRPSPASLLVLVGLSQLANGHFKATDPRAKYAISPVDPRIHFALVCGAKSCPPIRVYTPESLEQGLQAAAMAFCESSVIVDKAAQSVEMSMILKWYGGDFSGCLTGRLRELVQYLPPQPAADLEEILSKGDPKVTYTPYDWGVNKK